MFELLPIMPYNRHMIETITLTDFRNHKTARITTCGHRNVIITGPNGAGKTAVLEAVSMLSGDRGMRGAPWGEIARFGGSGGFSVFATGIIHNVGIVWNPFGFNKMIAIHKINFAIFISDFI